MNLKEARDIIYRFGLTDKERETVRAQVTSFKAGKEKYIKDHYIPVRQPMSHTNGCCLIVSALNCLDDDEQRRKFLGGIPDHMKFTDMQAYRQFQQYFTQQVSEHGYDPYIQYTFDGLKMWLNHLRRDLKVIKSFVWTRAKRFDSALGLSVFFQKEFGQNCAGKTYIMCGYRNGSDTKPGSVEPDYSRLCYTKHAQQLAEARRVVEDAEKKTESERKRRKTNVVNDYKKRSSPHEQRDKRIKAAQVEIMQKWQVVRASSDSPAPAPLDGYFNRDMASMQEAAVARTLMDVDDLNVVYASQREWMIATGRDAISFNKEVNHNLKGIEVECMERMAAEISYRDATSKETYDESTGELLDAGKKRKVGMVLTLDESKVRSGTDFKEPEEEIAVRKLLKLAKPARPLSTKKVAVSSHAVCLRVIENGDVVILDPALPKARILSKDDVAGTCREFTMLMAHYYSVFELNVEFA